MPDRYTHQSLTTNDMRSHALDQRAQLLGLVANHAHAEISKDDVCPLVVRDEDWTGAPRRALRQGYLQRSVTTRGHYVQGSLPAELSFQHDLWVVAYDAPWDLERKATLLYACTAVHMLNRKGMWPGQTLRQAIGCPQDLWGGVSNLLEYDTPFVVGPYSPEEVFCHVEGGYELYEDMLVEIAPDREDSVPNEYEYVFSGGDMS